MIQTDCFNPNCPLDQKLVIPAKAGIQLIEQFPRSGTISKYCLLRRLFILLDPSFRWDDKANGLFGFNCCKDQLKPIVN